MGNMIIYFDTNVYHLMVKRADPTEISSLVSLLIRKRARLAVGSDVIAEAVRIQDEKTRRERLQTITLLASKHLHPPSSYLQAQEILKEVRRCYPEWLSESPELATVEHLLAARKRIWSKLQRDGTIDLDLSSYVPLAERAIALSNPGQKEWRQLLLQTSSVEVKVANPGLQPLLGDQPNPERYWRIASMIAWWQALHGDPSMRDYRDWLAPYLRMSQISRTDWELLWLRDISASAVPRNRIQSLAEYHQTAFRISHGNPIDANHATHLLDCDLFCTADRNFYGVLEKIVTDIGLEVAVRLLLVRHGLSIADAVHVALEQMDI